MMEDAGITPAPRAPLPSKEEILRRNAIEYDDAADPYWRLTVYQPSHGGWWFSNVGGRRVLDDAARAAPLGPDDRVLELCSGLGDTCRYLAHRYGCRITGVEINSHQVRQARSRLTSLAPELTDRVRFEAGDVLRWRPEERFDAVVAVDALSLLEDRAGALDTAFRALRPGGLLLVADTLAGPGISAGVRGYVWEEDGLLNLPDPEGQERLLRQAGFRPAGRADLSSRGQELFRSMEAESLHHRGRLVAAKGERRWRRWLRNARLYGHWFGSGVLLYHRVLARRPGS